MILQKSFGGGQQTFCFIIIVIIINVENSLIFLIVLSND